MHWLAFIGFLVLTLMANALPWSAYQWILDNALHVFVGVPMVLAMLTISYRQGSGIAEEC